ncbi:petidase, M16 family, putative [Plasmodium relictum]|uniref:Petidase, M16 family, putative n=1 Tax=Plasmodium relictum TaxID=85471 RepID=A0A1J1H5A3_PLARL|nr:petidase, M16 family, putative [Plasmodium relictum]CRH00086.1 petidase, M16 family, putative [Plasmodium relictum]
MKNSKITTYLTVKCLLLLVLFFQKHSSQNSLNNRTNYGLNDEELKAMILGLNYNQSSKNKNEVDKENTENESLLLRNFINEDTFDNMKNEKEIEGIKKSKKKHFDASNRNISNKSTSLIKNEKKNTSLELKNYQSLQKTIESNKLNKEDNQYDNDENQDTDYFSDSYDFDNTNAFINKNDTSKLNYSNSHKKNDLYDINESNEANISNSTRLNDLKDVYNSNELNVLDEENEVSGLSDLSKEIDTDDTNITKEINNVNSINTPNNLNKRNITNDASSVQNINNLDKDNKANKLEHLTNNNNENSNNLNSVSNSNIRILRRENNINNLKNEHIFNDTSNINSNILNNNNANNISDIKASHKNNSNNNDKDINNFDKIDEVNNKITKNIDDNVNNINQTNKYNFNNNNTNAYDINGINNNLNYDDNKENINNVNYNNLSSTYRANDVHDVTISNNINDENSKNINNLNSNNVNYNDNDANDNSNTNNQNLNYNSNNISNSSNANNSNLSDNRNDTYGTNNNLNDINNSINSIYNNFSNNNSINDHNSSSIFHLNNNNAHYASNVSANNLNHGNNINDVNKINNGFNDNDINGLNKFNLNNYNVNNNNSNNHSKGNSNDSYLSDNNVSDKNGNLLFNDPKNINNYIKNLDNTNSEKSESSRNVMNIKNDEKIQEVNKLENEKSNNEVHKTSSENIDEPTGSKVFKVPKKRKPKNNDTFSMENDKKYDPEDMYHGKMNNSTESYNNYISNWKNNEKDELKQKNMDEYLKKNDNLNNALPKGLNFYKIGESDEKPRGLFNEEGQKKSPHFSEQKNLKNISDNDEKNDMKNSMEDTDGLDESKREVLKRINPVKFEEYINDKLYDTSEEKESKILNKTEKNWENLFSEKINLKKGEYDRNEYKYFKLKNNEFKVLGIINKYSPKGGFSISVDCGGYDDFNGIPGISHLLQHSIFYRSQKRSTTLLSELGKYSSEHNCHTNESFTNYYATANSEDVHHLLKLFADNLFYPVFDEEYIENEVREINNEYVAMENNPENCLKTVSEYITDFKYSKFFVYGNYVTLCQNVLRNGLNIKKILYEFHRKCYQPKNMSLSILLGKKIGSDNHYNMSDIENIVVEIFEKIKNYNYSKENDIIGKENSHIGLGKRNFNRRKNHYDNTNFIYNDTHYNFLGYNDNEYGTFIEFINKSNYIIDSNQKSKYVEILKKEGWEDQIYLYWSSKINIDLYKKIEEFGSINFLQEIFSDFKINGLKYKLLVENKYAYDFKIISTYNKYYLNYGTLIKLTKKGKSNLVHLLHIYNIFIKEITKLFDHDSLDKGLNKYILDYYREKAFVTDHNFNNNDVNVGLNDLINYSNKLLTYSDDPSLFSTINKLIEDRDKNDFRNHIKITSLIGSLIKNENLNILNVVDEFSITNQSKIPYTTITYATGENPYLIDEKEIINDINLKLPEIKVCPSSNFGSDNIFYEQNFFCVPYNNRENFEYSENKQMFMSQENKNALRSSILYNTPCLIKSSYGYNIYFKKGLTNVSRVKTDIIFYFPSKNFTFYEDIFTRIHIIILKKKIKIFLSDYTNCSVNINIKYSAGSYSIHIEANSDFFEELFKKLEELMSANEIPSTDEFNEAYDELNLSVQTNTKFGIENSLKIMHSLFNKYIPTDKEIYDILNSFFFYPSYNAYVKYINSFFQRNYISIFIYGNLIISNSKNNENSLNDNKNNVDNNSYNNTNNNNNITDNNNNEIKDNINVDSDNINSDMTENINSNNNDNSNIDNNYTNDKDNNNHDDNNLNNNENIDNNNEHKIKDNAYYRIDNENNSSYLKKKQEASEKREDFEEENFNSDSLQISFNASGIEYLVNLCESFIRKVTNSVIKRSESTYYTRKLINDEDIEINVQNTGQNISNSIIVSYMIESETILSDVLINIIADLISSDFIKFIKIRYNDGYIVNVKTFFTPYGLGGLLFVIQSFDKEVEKLQADICTFVKYLTFQLLNIEIPELIKKLEIMKESYVINNTIYTFNQEYSSIMDQLTIGHECFDKKDKIIKIFDELINCPQIILDKINYILKNSKKAIFKEYKPFNISNNKKEINDNNNINERCNYSYLKDIKMSNVQLIDDSHLIKTYKLNENKSVSNYDIFKMGELHKKENFINLPNFLQRGEKGLFQYFIDYFRSDDKSHLKDGNYLDFKSCDEEMSSENIHVFQNFTDNIKKIREYFLLKFTTDKEIKEKCSIDYEEIRKYCYVHNANDNDKENALK